MIIIGIEHINGEIIGNPFIIDENNINEFLLGPYFIYVIDYINKTIKEFYEK